MTTSMYTPTTAEQASTTGKVHQIIRNGEKMTPAHIVLCFKAKFGDMIRMFEIEIKER